MKKKGRGESIHPDFQMPQILHSKLRSITSCCFLAYIIPFSVENLLPDSAGYEFRLWSVSLLNGLRSERPSANSEPIRLRPLQAGSTGAEWQPPLASASAGRRPPERPSAPEYLGETDTENALYHFGIGRLRRWPKHHIVLVTGQKCASCAGIRSGIQGFDARRSVNPLQHYSQVNGHLQPRVGIA